MTNIAGLLYYSRPDLFPVFGAGFHHYTGRVMGRYILCSEMFSSSRNYEIMSRNIEK